MAIIGDPLASADLRLADAPSMPRRGGVRSWWAALGAMTCSLLLTAPAHAQEGTKTASTAPYVFESLTAAEADAARNTAKSVLAEHGFAGREGLVVLVETLNRTCPLRERITNYNTRAAWNVTAKLELTSAGTGIYGGGGTNLSGHVPYLPARSSVEISYACSMRGQLSLDSMKPDLRIAGSLSREVVGPWLTGPGDWAAEDGALVFSSLKTGTRDAIDEVFQVVAPGEDFRALFSATLAQAGGSRALTRALQRTTGTALAGKLDALVPADFDAFVAAATNREGTDLLGAYLPRTGVPARVDALVAALVKRKVPNLSLATSLASADRAVEAHLAALSRRMDEWTKSKDPALPEIRAALMDRALDPAAPAAMAEALVTSVAGLEGLEAAIRKAGGDGVLPLDTVLKTRRTIRAQLAYWRDRPTLAKCFQGADTARGCATLLTQRYAAETAGGLDSWATDGLRALLSRLVQDAATRDAAIEIYHLYQRFGVTAEPISEGLCQAAEAKATQGQASEAEALVGKLHGVDSAYSCKAASILEDRARAHRADAAKSWLFTILPFSIAIAWVVESGRRLRRKSKGGTAATPGGPEQGGMAHRISASAWQRTARDVVSALARGAEGGGDGAKAAMASLDRAAPRVTAKLAEVARRAVESGEVASTLLAPGSDPIADCVYLVAFPGAHDHPQALRRWPGFQQGWDAHVRCVAAAAAASYPKAPGLLTVVVFVRADATRGSACVDRRGKPGSFVPGALIERAELPAGDDAEVGGEPVGFSMS